MGTQSFKPDKEFLEFAQEFSGKYKILSPADYHSLGGKYHISYRDELLDRDGKKRNTMACVDLGSVNHIELDRTAFLADDRVTSDGVFFIILWCFAAESYDFDYKKLDLATLKFYLKLRRPGLNAYKFMLAVFGCADTQLNRERERNFKAALDEFYKQKREAVSEEIAADKNALEIYLRMGYSKASALKAFKNVFILPEFSDARYKKIRKFVSDWKPTKQLKTKNKKSND